MLNIIFTVAVNKHHKASDGSILENNGDFI